MNLLGSWKKIAQNPCSEKYPETLTFEQNNMYRGQGSENAATHPVWDVGTYELKEHAIGMTTSYDALVWYSLSMQDDVLILRDPEGCPIQYKREQ